MTVLEIRMEELTEKIIKVKSWRKFTSKAVIPLAPFFAKLRCFLRFFNIVSYNINCIEGLLTYNWRKNQW